MWLYGQGNQSLGYKVSFLTYRQILELMCGYMGKETKVWDIRLASLLIGKY